MVGIASANAGKLFIGTQNNGSVVVGSNLAGSRYRCNFVAPHNAVGDACFIGEQLGRAGVADGERAAGFLEGQHCLGIDIVECVAVVTAYNLNGGVGRNHNFAACLRTPHAFAYMVEHHAFAHLEIEGVAGAGVRCRRELIDTPGEIQGSDIF